MERQNDGYDKDWDIDSALTLRERMEKAKELYPGSKDWAHDEARLFEILYLRQDLPMLPSHWNIDFRGFPIPENIFATSDEFAPIVYAHSTGGSREFSATAAITRLIDLTMAVRTVMEAPSPHKSRDKKAVRRSAAHLIHDSLDRFCEWAARDGGYDKLSVVPNLAVEVIEAPEKQHDLVQSMTERMHDLVRLQQEFYRVDRDPDFWSTFEPHLTGSSSKRPGIRRSSLKRKRESSKKPASIKRQRLDFEDDTTPPSTPDLLWDDNDQAVASAGSTPGPRPQSQASGSAKRQRIGTSTPSPGVDRSADFRLPDPETPKIIKSEQPDDEADGKNSTKTTIKTESPPTQPRSGTATTSATAINPPRTPSSEPEYSRRPPVVYGLFIIGTSVFLLTADSSKGEDGYISFHVDINFSDNHQSVWNALTVAIAVCSARDELRSRLDDFDPASIEYDSDPDA
ncbi:hypothetical protein GMORB2_0276 [Geosmithia morbida]|uniref:Uncharacterized protein n=1 Tax=Geosmithia morbida TaxID=1094350 RepID=A0A9P4Z0X3_9HYPO|nr:uncharacterized protein GMORB2_0276 [Geosmithia morbida]KAF4126540.1 hypothetical protein GMORB2_0276 [Geosmithia morbida]